ncbi:DNA helicase [Tanacetum coccineum]
MRRKIEIENLNGNIIEFTLWDKMAEHFEQADLEKMEQPVIIAVNSCRVSKYKDYQLAVSPTTYYYLNPNIPEAEESRALETKKHIPVENTDGRESTELQGYIADTSGMVPLAFFTPSVDKIIGHPCGELVEKYKPVDQKKIPSEVLAVQGKKQRFSVSF